MLRLAFALQGHKKKGGQSSMLDARPHGSLAIQRLLRGRHPKQADRVWIEDTRADALRGVEHHERLVGVGIAKDARASRSLLR